MKSGNNNSSVQNVSVVVCVKNEEARIEDCLRSVVLNNPREIIVVDGGSTDRTVEIAKRYATRVICSKARSLSRDRQIGIDEVRNEYVAMIDADHRLKKGDLDSLYRDLIDLKLDIVQSQVKSFENHGFWDSAEEEAWDLTHNIPGPKSMIGTAPAIYKKRVFDRIKFDDHTTSTIDDTDFIYRLSKCPGVKIGVGRTVIRQEHFSDFETYVMKFKWYGKGDGEFCKKHPTRALSMFYHLIVRYPFLYSARAIRRKKFKAVPFFVVQGYMRFYGLMKYLLTS